MFKAALLSEDPHPGFLSFPFSGTGIDQDMEGTEIQASGPVTVLKDIFFRWEGN